MKKTFLTAALTLIACVLLAQNATNALDKFPKNIADAIFEQMHNLPNGTQISAAIVHNGTTRFYGALKTNDTIKAVDNRDCVFEIGSISKVMTAAVLASMVEEGTLKLTDEVNAYYPFAFRNGTAVRFVDLSNHTSGLPRLPDNLDLSTAEKNANPYKDYGVKEIEEYLRNILSLENEPASVYSYSNLGTGLLGYTLGLAAKTDFVELLQKRVFDKYNMTNTFTGSKNIGDKLVLGLGANGDVVPNWDFDVLIGAGGVLSTTRDLAKFANAQFDSSNSELAMTRIPTFTVNDNLKLGLGWHLFKFEDGRDLVAHNGGTGGYTSSMMVSTGDKTAAIVLSNISAFSPANGRAEKLCFELLKLTN